MTRYITTTITVSIHPEGENPIYGDRATHVSVEDEAGGGFLVIKQHGDSHEPGTVRLDPEELDAVAAAAKELISKYPKESEE